MHTQVQNCKERDEGFINISTFIPQFFLLLGLRVVHGFFPRTYIYMGEGYADSQEIHRDDERRAQRPPYDSSAVVKCYDESDPYLLFLLVLFFCYVLIDQTL